MQSATVILGLGGNKGDRAAQLAKAADLLDQVLENSRRSSLYETKALLPAGAPASWDMPFLNMAIAGDTKLSPHDVFALVKDIEKKMGRKPAEVWAPREIDIDILAMDDLVLEQPDLVVPHRALLERDFALLPLAELAPDWRYPAAGDHHGWKAADIVRIKGYATGSLQEKGIANYG